MKTGGFSFRCTAEQAAHLAAALRAFADAAYPPGGSECAQVARTTLRDAADCIARDASSRDGAALRRRQRAIMRTAVDWYFGPDGPVPDVRAEELLALLGSSAKRR